MEHGHPAILAPMPLVERVSSAAPSGPYKWISLCNGGFAWFCLQVPCQSNLQHHVSQRWPRKWNLYLSCFAFQFASCVSLWYFLLFLPIRTQDFCFWVSIFWRCGLDAWHSWDSGAAQPYLSYWVNVTYTIWQSGSSWQAITATSSYFNYMWGTGNLGKIHHRFGVIHAFSWLWDSPPRRCSAGEAWIDGACTACETVHFVGWCIFGTAVPWAKFGFPMCLKSSAIWSHGPFPCLWPPWAHVSKWPYIIIYTYNIY